MKQLDRHAPVGGAADGTDSVPRLAAVSVGACILAVAACGPQGPGPAAQPAATRSNILFISVDDLNDWIEPLGGHPQARTPNMSRLAAEGVLFTRAYTPSPSCNPARTALLTGRHPYNSGMYSNYQYWREVMPDVVTMPRYFSDNGYWSAGAGKIFHNNMPDPRSWDDYYPSLEQHMPRYTRPSAGGTVNMPTFENMYGDFDWAPLDIPDEETADFDSAQWVIEQLQRDRAEPFFLAAGIYRPHVPWYVPREYFDMFPLESIKLPALFENDLDDVPERGVELARRGGNYHRHVIEADQWKEAVQGYLASIAYADALVGRLLDALEASPHADNTIVMLWSDHGWQLGEKEHWRKFALWENLARVVLMVKVPEGTPGLPQGTPVGVPSARTVSLLDMFPTLIALSGIPSKQGLDGRDLTPLLADPDAAWDRPVITTFGYGEYSIRDERFRYIRYIDGSEELYDHDADPEEWTNRADDPDYAEDKARMAAYVPADPAPFVDTSYELMPHHIPPIRSLSDYLSRRR
jgi:arylsulfatase A-like enzyme